MFRPEQYQLLDFGHGEKLESVAATRIRRATPSVEAREKRTVNHDWQSSLRFQRSAEGGQWQGTSPVDWQIEHGPIRFLLRPTPAGQIGVFPEQACNWDWIESLAEDLSGLKAINLFGYTGGTTMALAARGVQVTHVDSARNVMQWARANAAAAGMDSLPIRWIVEDAMKFVQREINRGSKYDILVADPPSYGTGPKKERWKFSQDIETLLAGLASISSPSLRMLLLSCHTPNVEPEDLQQWVSEFFELSVSQLESFELDLLSASGKRLPSGSCVRYFV